MAPTICLIICFPCLMTIFKIMYCHPFSRIMSIFVYSFIKIVSVQYAQTCHLYIHPLRLYKCYNNKCKITLENLGCTVVPWFDFFYAGSTFLLIKLCNNVNILNSIPHFCFCSDWFWDLVEHMIF